MIVSVASKRSIRISYSRIKSSIKKSSIKKKKFTRKSRSINASPWCSLIEKKITTT